MSLIPAGAGNTRTVTRRVKVQDEIISPLKRQRISLKPFSLNYGFINANKKGDLLKALTRLELTVNLEENKLEHLNSFHEHV